MSGLLLLLGCAVVVIAWDIMLLQKGKRTISAEIQRGAMLRPIVAWFVGLVMGVLAGHWFWIPPECEAVLK